MVDGYHLSANKLISCDIVSANLNPEVFIDPLAFRPDRFQTDNIPGSAFLTFGYGIFGCIGKTFAMTTMKAIIANLLLSFRFTVEKEDEALKKYISFEINTRKPILVRVQHLN